MHERNLTAGQWHEEASHKAIPQAIRSDRRRELRALRYGHGKDTAHAVQQALLVKVPPAIRLDLYRRHPLSHALASLPRDQVGGGTGRLANVEREHEDPVGAKCGQAPYAHHAGAVIVEQRDLRPGQMVGYVRYQAAEIRGQDDIVLKYQCVIQAVFQDRLIDELVAQSASGNAPREQVTREQRRRHHGWVIDIQNAAVDAFYDLVIQPCLVQFGRDMLSPRR
jgi:hypothetical protein